MPNSSYYLYNGQIVWTMSPSYFNSYGTNVSAWYMLSSGVINPWYGVSSSFGIRPVINLRSDIKITKGAGTALNPYVVSLD